VPNRVFAYEMTESSFFKSYTERCAIEPVGTGCRFTFDDNLVFPYGPFGKVMGWFGERMARKSSEQILENLKRLAEGDAAR
jgi:Polyketide cyclase / dehydrase and lipid transport